MPHAPLSNYLRMYRKRSGLSQPELAFLLGCAHGSKISRYERGERSPSLDTLIAYELLFRGSTQELFTGQFDRVVRDIRRRAASLRRKVVKTAADTPQLKRKVAFLVGVQNAARPGRPS